MPKFCSKCGGTLTDGIKFCSSCGNPINMSTKEETSLSVHSEIIIDQDNPVPPETSEKIKDLQNSDQDISKISSDQTIAHNPTISSENTHGLLHNKKFIFISIVIVILALSAGVVVYNKNSPDRARKQLTSMNIEYTYNDFIKTIENNDEKAIKLFLDSGMEIDGRNDKKETTLMAAAKISNETLIKNIIKIQPAMINNVDVNGQSALFYAVLNNQKKAVDILSNAGADWTKVDEKKANLLHCALLVGNNEFVKMAIDKEVDINAKTVDGQSPLQIAKEKSNQEMAQYLLDHGAIDEVAQREAMKQKYIKALYGGWGKYQTDDIVWFDNNRDIYVAEQSKHGLIYGYRYYKKFSDTSHLDDNTGAGSIEVTFTDGTKRYMNFHNKNSMTMKTMWNNGKVSTSEVSKISNTVPQNQ